MNNITRTVWFALLLGTLAGGWHDLFFALIAIATVDAGAQLIQAKRAA